MPVASSGIGAVFRVDLWRPGSFTHRVKLISSPRRFNAGLMFAKVRMSFSHEKSKTALLKVFGRATQKRRIVPHVAKCKIAPIAEHAPIFARPVIMIDREKPRAVSLTTDFATGRFNDAESVQFR